MKVKLKQHIMEGRHIKTAQRKNADWSPPKVVDGQLVECQEPEFKIIPYVQGTVIEMSDASAKKWIEEGKAEEGHRH